MSAKKRSSSKGSQKTIKFTTRPNPFPEGKGKYYGVTIPNGTVDQEGLIDYMVQEDSRFNRNYLRYMLNTLGLFVLDQMRKNPRPIDIGFCKFVPVIKGRFSHKDEEFDPKKHKLVVEVVLSPEMSRAVADGLKAVNVTPVDVPSPSIDSVCQAPDYARNAISCDAPFEIHGVGLTTGLGGESAELVFKSGASVPLELKPQTKADGARRVKVRLAGSLPSPRPKRAWLVFRTHGLGGAKSPLQEVKSSALKLA